MSALYDEMKATLDPVDPLNGDYIHLVNTWEEFLEWTYILRGMAAQKWERHDASGKVITSPLTTPEFYKDRWWPEDGDMCANIREAKVPVFPMTNVRGASVYNRLSPTRLFNTIRFGHRAPTNHGITAWYDLGIRQMEFIVHTAGRRDNVILQYAVEGHKVEYKEIEPDMWYVTVHFRSRPPERLRDARHAR